MNKYPLHDMAKELESYGRYGDSMLVHLNPAEVAGLASLSPTGRLTTNPVTGQPEAFLPMLAPLLGSWLGGTALAGTTLGAALGPTLSAALGSGLATTAVTGDIERGFAAGIMGAGLGSAFGGAGSGAGEAATTGLDSVNLLADATSGAGTGVAASSAADYSNLLADGASGANPGMAGASAADYSNFLGQNPSIPMLEGTAGSGPSPTLGDKFTAGMDKISDPAAILPIAIGGSELANMDQRDKWEKEAEDKLREESGENEEAYRNLQSAYRRSQPNLQPGASSYRQYMSDYVPKYAEGGAVSTEEGVYSLPGGGVARKIMSQGRTPVVGASIMSAPTGWQGRGGTDTSMDGTGIDPVSVQAGLRGDFQVTPPEGFRAGFDPEFSYFQNKEDLNLPMPSPGDPNYEANKYDFKPSEIDPNWNYKKFDFPTYGINNKDLVQLAYDNGSLDKGTYDWEMNNMREQPSRGEGKYYSSKNYYEAPGSQVSKEGPERSAYKKKLFKSLYNEDSWGDGYAEGGEVSLNTATGPVPVAAGGIASVPTDMLAAPQAPQEQPMPTPEELQMVEMAVMKGGEGADQFIEMFVQKYGPELFAQIRQFLLQQGNPQTQTEGMISGPGGGMDDQIGGMIGDQQPVAVSSGEFIVPADVVSGIGDGSSEAGAQELSQMMDNVRMSRGGSTTQPPPTNARGLLPA
jgi:hypothetical protein